MIIRDDPAALASYAAEWLLDRLAGPATTRVALSGGSTPKAMFTLLGSDPYASRMPWERIHWFWGDERFVPHDDPRSNYAMAQAAMLRHAPPGTVHPVPFEGMTADQAATAYDQLLRTHYGAPTLDPARPLFDVVLLGLGTNGHTASLFPDEPVLKERVAWAAATTPPGEPTRVTLTFPALESCRDAVFLVAGPDKRPVVAAVQARTTALPASHYRPRGTLHWFVDRAAAP